MTFDLNAGKAVAEREDAGTTIHVRDAAGEKMYQDEAGTVPVTITVAGTYSTRYRKLMDASGDKSWKKRGTMEAEDSRRNTLEIIAGCVLGWDGFVASGEPFACNKTNACILLDSCPWIREQVEKAMTDHASFFGQPSAS